MTSIARRRLAQEKNEWRKNHPPGFSAKYFSIQNGSQIEQDPMKWICKIPGRKGVRFITLLFYIKSAWAGGEYTLIMEFSEDYPSKPPKCKFDPVLFHPNIYPSGTVCLSILNEDEDWKPSITILQILLGIQDLLDNPNTKSPAQADPYYLFTTNKPEYIKRVRKLAQEFSPKY